MHRRRRLLLVALAAATAASLLGLPRTGFGVPASAAPEPRPNIVLITTDDQAVSDLRWMPLTRQLIGDAGVRFTDFISPNPLCCPARASILTGQYSQNNGVYANKGRFGGFPNLDATRTVATWLHDGGYQTGFVGKYLNLYRGDPPTQPGWDVFDAVVRGIYAYFDYLTTGNGTPTEYHGVHSNDTIAARTRDLVAQFSADADPFFIWASYVAPHGTCGRSPEVTCTQRPMPASRHADWYPDEVAPQLSKPSFNEDVSDKPQMVSGLEEADPAHVQDLFTERIRSLASVDEAVADTVAALEEAGELDDTLIVFTSDNGYLLGEHRHLGKVLPYQESLRVPMLVRGPGVPTGEVRSQPASLIDLAPTFAALAGVEPDLVTDGRDLMSLIDRTRPQPQHTHLIQTSRYGARRTTYAGVVTPRYTYVRWPYGFVELYDREADPYELTNVAGRVRYGAVERALRDRFQALRDCSGATCRVRFPALPSP